MTHLLTLLLLRRLAPSCAVLRRFAPFCAVLHHFAPFRAVLRRFATVGDRGTKYLGGSNPSPPCQSIVAETGGRGPPFPPKNIFSGFFQEDEVLARHYLPKLR